MYYDDGGGSSLLTAMKMAHVASLGVLAAPESSLGDSGALLGYNVGPLSVRLGAPSVQRLSLFGTAREGAADPVSGQTGKSD